jgi:sortase A
MSSPQAEPTATGALTTRRVVRDVSWVLILAGILLVLDAGLTLVWQEPVTAVIAAIERTQIDRRFESYELTPLSRLDRHALAGLRLSSERIAFLARREQRQLQNGDAIGRLEIAKLGASFDVVQGTDASSLRKGPGHYPSTALPGLGRTVAIAGHRTTYLAPFRRVNELAPGDRIVLKMPYATFSYVVQRLQIVLPTALRVTDDVGYERLVLSACHPLYSASHRIIVFARLQEVQPGAI